MPEPLGQADARQHLHGGLAGVLAAGQFQRQHDVLQRGQVAQQLEALEDETHLLRTQRGAVVFIDGKNILPGKAHGAAGGGIEPGDDGQQRALARARGPNDGGGFLGSSRVKSISRKMSSVPVESVTDLKTCSTEMMAERTGLDMKGFLF
jgi:hypothetical protein